MADRVACLIPGCRRSVAASALPPGWEWICGRHWPAVPKLMRRAYARAKRRHKAVEVQHRIWARCKRAAINEALMGF